MDDSMSSTNYTNKCPSPTETSENSSQESGWTFYLDDFEVENHDIEDKEGSSFAGCQSSLVASGDVKCGDDNHPEVAAAYLKLNRNHGKLISKKRKTKATFVDQDLEDTACSPVHSPKVCDISQMFVKSEETATRDLSQAYESGNVWKIRCNNFQSFYQEKKHILQKATEGIDMDLFETELRRKGLCLAPMSLLFNFS